MAYTKDDGADILLLGYLCDHSMHYSGREMEITSTVDTWAGEQESATFIDVLLR